MIRCTLVFLVVLMTLPLMTFADEQTADYRFEKNIPYRSHDEEELTEYMRERCRLDLYYPANAGNFATVVWFHGGGLRMGEKTVPEELKGKGFAVAAVNYRLFPNVNSPAYVDDAAAATAWVLRQIEDYGGDPRLVFVSGHSAGGYLTMMVGLDKGYLAKYEADANNLAGLIPFSGHTITHFTVREERGIRDTQPIVDEMAPLYHVRPDAPPLLLITGDRELEMLGRYEENAYMARMMKVAGHSGTRILELDGFDHSTMVPPAHALLIKEVDSIVDQRREDP